MTVREQIEALQDLSTAELAAEYERLHGRRPRYRSPAWMKKRIAFQLQVAAYGGLSAPARAEIDRLASELKLPDAAPQPRTADDDGRGPQGRPRPGQVLTREWRGKQIRVEVTADGFVYDGEAFGSLSAVAKRITGQHMSGPAFFGTAARRAKA